LKELQTQLEERPTEKGAIQAEIDKHQLQMEALGKAVETLRRERDQLKQKSDGTQAQLEKERAKIAQEVQALQKELAGTQNQLELLQSMGKRLDNLPPNAPQSLVQEARELRELLADKGRDSLKERLLRVLRELQSASKDVVTDILKGGR
jgi:predicted translin family RNA/ssDNA-binding protein